MKEALISFFALGVMDFFNPVAIAMVLALLTMVKRRGHVIYYLAGSYVAYATASVGIYFGVDRFLLGFVRDVTARYPAVVSAAQLLLALVCAVGAVVMGIYLVRALAQKKELSMQRVLFIKSVAPWFILLLSFGSTWSNMPAAVFVLAYMGVLIAHDIATAASVTLLAVFCLFSSVPAVAVYVMSIRAESGRFQAFVQKLSRIATAFCLFSIPVVLALIALWGAADGIQRLGGM